MIVDRITDIIARKGADSYLGEVVNMRAHMLQAAAQAEDEAADDELIAAALLHDIGHYVSELGEGSFDHGVDNLHDEAGAALLAKHFSPRIVDCVRLHVAAKRYLCATDPDYFSLLSPASVQTLKIQGGPMDAEEVAAFEAEPHYAEAVRVRRWDEGAKDPDRATPPFAHYVPLLERLAR